MIGFPGPGSYTVQAKVAGSDLVASLYAVGADIYIGSASIVCGVLASAYAVIGLPITPSGAVDSTRSGNIDSSLYVPPLRIPAGQSYSIIWVSASNSSASMSVQVVDKP